jgi:hypothetical protein
MKVVYLLLLNKPVFNLSTCLFGKRVISFSAGKEHWDQSIGLVNMQILGKREGTDRTFVDLRQILGESSRAGDCIYMILCIHIGMMLEHVYHR